MNLILKYCAIIISLLLKGIEANDFQQDDEETSTHQILKHRFVVDIPIPGNDDAVRSIKLILNTLTDSIIEGQLKTK